MSWNRRLSLVFFLVAVALAGYLLRSFVPNVLTEYEQARSFGPLWGYVYLGILGLSVTAFALLIGWGVWTLVANSWRKSARRVAGSRNPSQMSNRERREEIEARIAESQVLADDAQLSAESREPIRRSIGELQAKLDSQTL